MSKAKQLAVTSLILVFCAVSAHAGLFHHKKAQNPLANVDSKQPDKVLFDRAMDAMKHGRYDVARITLQTLINTYPDSEYIARAKLAVGDTWYAEAGTTGMAQAEIEYKDFITFFPNMPEAAEAQLKVANIHYRQMEKADRDFTHAKRAEDEYRQMILQFPDSKLVPQAQQRLREVQEVLAEREFRIGRFYFMRESWPAAIARLKTAADTYPLYSKADETLYMLGTAYEKEIEIARNARNTNEAAKGRLIADFTNKAAETYARIITRYPAMDRADDAKHRMQALGRAVPAPTLEAVALNKAEEASRKEPGKMAKLMGTFRSRPDVSEAAKVGQPTMDAPQESSAVEFVRQAGRDIQGQPAASDVTLEVKNGTPPQSEPIPSSAPGTASAGPAANNPASSAASSPASSGPDNSASAAPNNPDTAIPELKPIESNPPQQTAPAAPASVPPAPATPAQAAPAQAGDTAQSAISDPANVADNVAAQPKQNGGKDESSSKKKKKKGLRKLVPF